MSGEESHSFTDKDAYRYRNKKAVDNLIPSVCKTLIKWGCNKRPNETFREYWKGQQLDFIIFDDAVNPLRSTVNTDKALPAESKEKFETVLGIIDDLLGNVTQKSIDDVDKDLESLKKVSAEAHVHMSKIEKANPKKKYEKCRTLFETIVTQLPDDASRRSVAKKIVRDCYEGINIKKKRLLVKGFNARDRQFFEAEECSMSFDASILLKLIPLVCTTENPSEKGWLRLQELLEKLKTIRDEVNHQPRGAAEDGTVFGTTETVLIDALEVAAGLYSKNEELEAGKEELLKNIEEINRTLSTDDTKKLIYFGKVLCEDGMKEHEEFHKNKLFSFLRFPKTQGRATLENIYHPIAMSFTYYGRNDQSESSPFLATEENFEELLRRSEGSYVFLEGPPGSGKTTLLKRIQLYFLLNKESKIHGITRPRTVLLSMESSDTSVNSIPELLTRNFRETMSKLNKDLAAEALKEVNLLITVDGYDELSPNSERVLKELLGNCGVEKGVTFLITSRPGESHSLKTQLIEERKSCITATLLPITEQPEQIKLIQNYQKVIAKTDDVNEILEKYGNLDEFFKDSLTLPEHLAQFWHMYHTSLEDDTQWDIESGILEKCLKLSQSSISQRLCRAHIKNYKLVAFDLIKAACNASLLLIQQKKTENFDEKIVMDMYNKMSISPLKRKSSTVSKMLSCMFVRDPEKPGTLSHVVNSHVIYMAAKAVIYYLEDCESCRVTNFKEIFRIISVIVGEQMESLKREKYRDVLRYVIMNLVGRKNSSIPLHRYLEEIRVAFEGEDDCTFWLDLTSSCSISGDVAKVSAMAAKGGTWMLDSPRRINAANVMIKHDKPSRIEVSLFTPSAKTAPELISLKPPASLRLLLETLAGTNYDGRLSLRLGHSFSELYSVDELLIILQSARCHITEFVGALDTIPSAMEVLVASGTHQADHEENSIKLSIRLVDPLRHQLGALDNTPHQLVVRASVGHEAAVTAEYSSLPLPRSSGVPAALILDCSDTTEVEDVVALVTFLAPVDKRLRRLVLHRWQGFKHNESLLRQLASVGIWTHEKEEEECPRCAPASNLEELICQSCIMNTHSPEERCVDILLPYGTGLPTTPEHLAPEESLASKEPMLPEEPLASLEPVAPEADGWSLSVEKQNEDGPRLSDENINLHSVGRDLVGRQKSQKKDIAHQSLEGKTDESCSSRECSSASQPQSEEHNSTSENPDSGSATQNQLREQESNYERQSKKQEISPKHNKSGVDPQYPSRVRESLHNDEKSGSASRIPSRDREPNSAVQNRHSAVQSRSSTREVAPGYHDARSATEGLSSARSNTLELQDTNETPHSVRRDRGGISTNSFDAPRLEQGQGESQSYGLNRDAAPNIQQEVNGTPNIRGRHPAQQFQRGGQGSRHINPGRTDTPRFLRAEPPGFRPFAAIRNAGPPFRQERPGYRPINQNWNPTPHYNMVGPQHPPYNPTGYPAPRFQQELPYREEHPRGHAPPRGTMRGRPRARR